MKITQEYLLSVFDYNPETGVLKYKQRPIHHFKSKSAFSNWNNNKAGKVLTYVGNHGYIEVAIDYKKYLAHRIIWFIEHGYWPNEIDHLNGIKTDNRSANIIDTDRKTNCKNLPMRKSNKLNVTGVRLRKYGYEVYINNNGRLLSLGNTKDFFEAVCLRKSAERKLGYSLQHGRLQ